ncbi:MAG: hypothetical protein A2V83_11880 [Nitrospirae bacterium RBG_16_64_22]|nr:MAG: hypothetical protein A2V83_11880 [Nitrospirae bacterium RBG_16_64_22]
MTPLMNRSAFRLAVIIAAGLPYAAVAPAYGEAKAPAGVRLNPGQILESVLPIETGGTGTLTVQLRLLPEGTYSLILDPDIPECAYEVAGNLFPPTKMVRGRAIIQVTSKAVKNGEVHVRVRKRLPGVPAAETDAIARDGELVVTIRGTGMAFRTKSGATEGLCSVGGDWLREVPFRFMATAWVVPEGGDARHRTVETQPAGFVLDPSVVPEHAVTAGRYRSKGTDVPYEVDVLHEKGGMFQGVMSAPAPARGKFAFAPGELIFRMWPTGKSHGFAGGHRMRVGRSEEEWRAANFVVDDDKIVVETSGLRWTLDLVKAAPRKAVEEKPGFDLSGTWGITIRDEQSAAASRGPAHVSQTQGKIVLRYGPGFQSVLTGTYKGNRVDFQGRDADGVSGSGYLVVAADGKSLEGRWRRDDGMSSASIQLSRF